jgi:zinc protease
MGVKILKLALLSGLLFMQNAWAVPEIQHWQTKNGARVYFIPAMDLPMVDINIVFDAGSARDAGKAGTALLTNGMLSEGAAGKDAQFLAEEFENVGANFGNSVLKDMATLSVRSLTEERYLNPALINLKNILTKPNFPSSAFERELSRMKISLKARKQSPSAIAGEVFMKNLYGDHPYALPTGGTEKSLKTLRLADLKKYYKQYYVAKNAVVAIVGNLTRQQAEKITNDLFEGLAAGKRAAPLPAVKPLEKSKTVRIDFPSAQSHILMGQLGIKRGDKDYFTLYVANHPFGGSGFASRLVGEVREKKGLAYSVYSYFSPMRMQGPFQLGLQTRNDQAEQALDIVKSELKKYVAEGPVAKELDASLKNITGGFPLRVDSNSKLVGYLAMIGFYDLTLGYMNQFVGKIKSVNIDMVKDALKRRVQPDKMLTVIVGAQKPRDSAGAQ